MKHIDFTVPLPQGYDQEHLARQVRHLAARLQDFGPGGPELLSADQKTGQVRARFPGHDADDIRRQLETRFGVRTRLDGDGLRFQLSPHIAFEELDYVWGCLFELLY